VIQVRRLQTGHHARVSAFLCGTFALALGLVLVLDPDDDDDDQPLVLTTGAAPDTQAPVVQKQTQKKLKVAKSNKLRPKKTAFKKRSKRVFSMQDSGPPVPASQRPRRGVAEAPHLALPVTATHLDAPDLTLTRLQPGPHDPLPSSPHGWHHLIRGPPSPVLS
jgi:hypothetical protein